MRFLSFLIILMLDSVFLSAFTNCNPHQRTVLEKNTVCSPKLMAHRGLQSMGPENSFTSFKEAARRGMWAIETDFRMTADGQVVCMHDKTLDRTTDGTGPVCEKTLAEIKALNVMPVNTKTVVKQYDYDAISDDERKVPTMDEYFEICSASGCVAFIELKEDMGVIESMMSSIEKFGMQGRCVVSSGKLELLERYRALGGMEMVHKIFVKPEELGRVKELGNASVSFKYGDLDAIVDVSFDGVRINSLKELVDYIHSLGMKVCFRAADDTETALKAIALGVDVIPTNVLHSIGR